MAKPLFSKPSRRFGRLVASVVIASAVAACAVTRGPAPRTFDLPAAEPGRSAGGSSAHIVVMAPRALASLDNERIMVRQGGGEISYFPGAQWSATLSRLVQARIAESFTNTGRVRAIGQQGDGIAADYLVVTELREFALNVAGPREASVEIFVKLINDRSGRVVASATFEADTPVPSDDLDRVVEGLRASFETVAADIVAFTLKRI